MNKSLTATKVLRKPQTISREQAKLNGMTEWFMPKEIDEMQMRLNSEFLQWLKGLRGYGQANE